jgi:excisionase family DNA binding protein
VDKLPLTPEETADVLGIGRSTVYDLMRLRLLPSVKIGRARRVHADAVRSYVDDLSTVATPHESSPRER